MSNCQQCSSPLPGDAPRGMCPACLLSTGLGEPPGGDECAILPDLGGRYRLGDVLGEGGFGTVFRAEQTEPVRREVAVKILKPGMVAGQVLARFEAERQALAMMDHPHIASVLDAGESEDGRPYIVMELVDGAAITEHCDAEKLSLKMRLRLMQKVADAVSHAHQKGIIHRDLKPSNILVSRAGKPSVIDFGIAKALAEPLTDRPLYTKIHQAVGTPAYMSPEQCGGHAGEVDTRSDVYALGAVLYELVSGRPPFLAEELASMSYVDAIREIRDREPSPPSSSNKKLPLELDWLCARALAKEPERRYSGAAQFGRDIERLLNNEPLAAGPPSRAYALRKLVRRHRGTFAAGAFAAVALVVGLLVSLSLYFKAENARQDVAEGRDALQLSYVQRDLNDGRNAARSGRAADAVAYFCNALRGDPDNEVATSQLLGLLLHHRWIRPLRAPVDLPEGVGEPIAFVADSEGGRGVMLCRGEVGLSVLVVDAAGLRVEPIEIDRAAAGIAVVAGTDDLIVWGGRMVRAYSLRGEGAPFTDFELDSPIRVWDMIHDQRVPSLLVGCENGEVRRVDLRDGRSWAAMRMKDPVTRIVAGERVGAPFCIVSGGKLYAVERGKPRAKLVLEVPGEVTALEILKPGGQVAVAFEGGGAGVYSFGDEANVTSLGGLAEVTGGFDYLPGSQLLVAAHGNGEARLLQLDRTTGTVRDRGAAQRHRGAVRKVLFTRDGRSVISTDSKGVARVWDVETGKGEPLRAGGRADYLVTDPQARMALSYDAETRRATLWSIDRSPAISPRVDWFGQMKLAVFSPPHEGGDAVDLASGARVQAAGTIRFVATSADGARCVTCVDHRTLQLWRTRDGVELCQRWVVDPGVHGIAFAAPDLLSVRYANGAVRQVPLPEVGANLSPEFLRFAEAFACRRLAASGLVTVPAQALPELSKVDASTGLGGRYRDWLLGAGESRDLWPSSAWTVGGYGAQLLELGTKDAAREAARLGKAEATAHLKALGSQRR